MTKPAIKVEGLYKEYVVGHAHEQHDTFYELLTQTIKAPLKRLRSLGGQTEEKERFWALQDVNFEVQPGEVVGIIGRNGAGKSTLLKILSRITAPSKGRIEVRGRLASLLEVGTGFHPELSGRENIYLNATILGMGQKEISRKFDAIVEFSGVEKFLDTPVKRYSSGMYVRLAFAVAAHVEADILLVDEVLAVGDAEFQRRCLGKMEQVASAGRTVLFVSHNLTAVKSLCSRGLLLDQGTVVKMSPVDDAIEGYINAGAIAINEKLLEVDRAHVDAAYISRISVKQADGVGGERLSAIKPLSVVIDVEILVTGNIDVFLHCYDEQQSMVFSSGSFFDETVNTKTIATGTHRFVCELPGHLLNDGSYTLDVMLVRNRREVFLTEPAVLSFRVEDDFPIIQDWQWRPAGVIRPQLKWSHQASPADRQCS